MNCKCREARQCRSMHAGPKRRSGCIMVSSSERWNFETGGSRLPAGLSIRRTTWLQKGCHPLRLPAVPTAARLQPIGIFPLATQTHDSRVCFDISHIFVRKLFFALLSMNARLLAYGPILACHSSFVQYINSIFWKFVNLFAYGVFNLCLSVVICQFTIEQRACVAWKSFLSLFRNCSSHKMRFVTLLPSDAHFSAPLEQLIRQLMCILRRYSSETVFLRPSSVCCIFLRSSRTIAVATCVLRYLRVLFDSHESRHS